MKTKNMERKKVSKPLKIVLNILNILNILKLVYFSTLFYYNRLRIAYLFLQMNNYSGNESQEFPVLMKFLMKLLADKF